jgi:predicted DNA binding CopG/RHH family protein
MAKRKNNDPLKNLYLDEEEALLEAALEQGQYEETPGFNETKTMLEEAASRYLSLHHSKPVTIRINQLDLIKIKARAKRKGIPYQTLLGTLIHDFAEGEKELKL